MYNDGNLAYFMDNVTFDQVGLPMAKIGALMKFLTENMEVEGLYLNEKFFNIALPANIVMTITETVQGVKGDTVSNVMKPAKVNTGLEIKVPLFINEGDKVRVDTRTFEYVERVTEPKK
jgi:elongation factor P